MRAAIIPFLVFVALITVFASGLRQDPSYEPTSRVIDRPTPVFTLPSLEGTELSDQDLSGQISLVNFFASWCLPCRVEHPILKRAADQVPIYGINYKDDTEKVKNWLSQHGSVYRKVGLDPEGASSILWGISGIPETFIVDSQGRIRYHHVGVLSREDLETVFLPLISSLR